MNKVSFIIAAYNVEQYIYECVDSCLNQTYKNIEVCITDDGSTDDTWKLLINRYGQDSRVKLDRFSKNQGKVAAFNNSYRISTGDYIAIMGADDICFSDRVEKSINELQNYDLVVGNLMTFCESGVLTSDHMYSLHKINEEKIVSFTDLLLSPIVFGGTLTAKRKLLDEIFPIDIKLAHEDWWIPLAAAYKKDIKYITDLFVKYRIHDSSSTNSNLKKSFTDWKKHNSRDVYYFNKVLENFELNELQHNYVLFNMYKSEIFSEKSIVQRIKKFNYIAKYEKSFTNKGYFFLISLNPWLAYNIYIIRSYRKRVKMYNRSLSSNKGAQA